MRYVPAGSVFTYPAGARRAYRGMPAVAAAEHRCEFFCCSMVIWSNARRTAIRAL